MPDPDDSTSTDHATTVDVGRAQRQVRNPEVEVPYAEPASMYFAPAPGTAILIDSAWELADADGGEFDVSLDPGTIQGAVLSIRDERNTDIEGAEAHPAIVDRYSRPGAVKLTGRWVRLDRAPDNNDPDHLFRELGEHDRRLRRSTPTEMPLTVRGKSGEREVRVAAAVFPEEAPGGGKRDAWLFAVEISTPPDGESRRERRARQRDQKPSDDANVIFVRGWPAGVSDLKVRIPDAELTDYTIAQFGLGTLGIEAAHRFASNLTHELRVLDHDLVDPATVVRWGTGFTAAGWPKVDWVSTTFTANYPYTTVRPMRHALGGPRFHERVRSDLDVLAEMLDGADLVFDATGNVDVNNLLADQAAARQLPYIHVSGTHGAWGGLVARITDATEGCWTCIQWHLDDARRHRGTIHEIKAPPADPAGQVQPAGCGEITFTGAGFDLAPLALQGVRLSVSTLRGDTYGPLNWDVGILRLRDEDGNPIPPKWETHRLHAHPKCGCTEQSRATA